MISLDLICYVIVCSQWKTQVNKLKIMWIQLNMKIILELGFMSGCAHMIDCTDPSLIFAYACFGLAHVAWLKIGKNLYFDFLIWLLW